MNYQIVIPKPAQKQLDNISKIERDRLILTLRSLANDPLYNQSKAKPKPTKSNKSETPSENHSII